MLQAIGQKTYIILTGNFFYTLKIQYFKTFANELSMPYKISFSMLLFGL